MYSSNQATSSLRLSPAVDITENIHLGAHWSLLFQRDFQLKVAESAAEKLQTFKLRHQVYCEELGFEPCNIAGLETDEYDARSAHYLLQHRHSGIPAGTMRMITCNQTALKLPVEQYFAGAFTADSLQPSKFQPETICELSRLALAADFRRQPGAANKALLPINSFQNVDMYGHYRYLAAALYLAALEHTQLQGFKHAYAVVAPSLARMLNKVGFQFQQISEPIELNGKRAAYYLDLTSCLHTLCDDYKLLRQVLAAQLASAGFQSI